MFRTLHYCKITDIMGYRSEELNSKTPEYRKKLVKDMKRIYALPRSLSEQQKIDELKRLKKQAGNPQSFFEQFLLTKISECVIL